ncbi:MAG: hypothetical protein IJQ81_08105 [Oscillibacter sp.]|nr:hypothetical protein [Oscillibacter sp.]
MSFDEIVLSKEEMELLKILSSEGAILVEDTNRKIIRRLEHFGLAQTGVVTNPRLFDEAREKSGDMIPKAAIITDKGRDYLAYLEGKEADSRRDFRRGALMLLIGGCILLLFIFQVSALLKLAGA